MIQGRRYKRLSADTTAAYRHTPIILTEDILSVVPYDCVPVAVEIVDDAVNLGSYTHPVRAMYIFGPEDGSISKAILAKVRDIVYIPTKYCMNLAATVNVVLYDRLVKVDKKDTKDRIIKHLSDDLMRLGQRYTQLQLDNKK